MLHRNVELTLFFHAEAMINPQLMTLGLSNGATVAVKPRDRQHEAIGGSKRRGRG
jgi:hypothetical protein